MTSETKKILLDKLKLSDGYELPYSEIEWRAKDTADVRAELYSWLDVEIKFVRMYEEPWEDTNYYEFEIWGHEQEKEQNNEKLVDKL